MVPVSRETAQRLDLFVALLLKWQRVSNLIADSSVHHLWTRHIADSLQLLPLAPEARTWVDLGSGAGFPGLVLGCALADMPGARVHLIESNGKKAAFLREAVRISGAAASIAVLRTVRPAALARRAAGLVPRRLVVGVLAVVLGSVLALGVLLGAILSALL